MGGLSSGPGPGICFLTLCLLLLAQQSHSAPVQEDILPQQSRVQGYYDGSSSELSSGCYYNFQHYGEGDRIMTNEPCLNCTCRNRMLMCYLRVCPFTKAIGQNCTIEKKPGQCCPLIVCPEVPVQLLTSSTTTEHSESMSHKTHLSYGHHGTAVGHLDDYGCRINGEFYTNGAQIPGNIDKPCEVCYCIRNRTACIMQECTLQVEGCIPVYEEGLCCPVRYQCDYEYNYTAITTEEPRPTPGLVLTTTSGPFECHHDGKWYADGSSVDTEDPCEHCYCMKGDIVCAVQECKPPFEKDGHNCTAMPPAPGKCCPDSYHCDGNEIVAASETTFRQDRMHKFGLNNANVTMSITSSTSSTDKHHGWHYGTNVNENDTPNRFTDDKNKDGTAGEDGHMMITEGIPPTAGPLESGSHHLEDHYDRKPVSEGHGVNMDNMLTISQVIHSIIHNQTQLLNQNMLNETVIGSEEPVKQSGDVTHDDKIYFPIEQTEDGKRPQLPVDEDGNPLESHSTASDLPEDYYGFTGGSSDIYAEHSSRPQTRPTKPSGVGIGLGKPQQGQAIFGEHGHFGRPIKRPVAAFGQHEGTDSYQGTNELPERWTSQPGKTPITQKEPGMDGTFLMTDEMGNPIEGVPGLQEEFTDKPGSGTVYIYYDEHGRPHKRPVSHKQPGMTGSNEGGTNVHEGMTEVPEGFTGRPVGHGTYIYYDEHGRPYNRPVAQNQPGGSVTKDQTQDTGLSEGFTEKPVGQEGFFGVHGHSGRPIKKPIIQKQPLLGGDIGATGTYDELTGSPQDFTGKPEVHGRPGIIGLDIMTDEDEVIGSSYAYTGQPDTVDKHSHPTSVNTRPGMQDSITEVYERTTEIFEGNTGQSMLEIYDEHGHSGRPQLKPGGIEGEANKNRTTLVEEGTKMPGQYGSSEIVGEYSETERPHKKPVYDIPGPEGMKVTTDENGKVIEGTTEIVIGQTGKPDSDGAQINHDEQGQRKPGGHKRPGEVTTGYSEHPIEGVTGLPEYGTGKPGEGNQIFYDKYGRPHLRPLHKKPVMDIQSTTDGYGDSSEQYEGTTYTPFNDNKTPGHAIVHDHHGRPIQIPAYNIQGMNGVHVSTDKDGNPIEDKTEITEIFTGKPDINDYVIYYDQSGRPVKISLGQRRPEDYGLNGKPSENQDGTTETPEGYTGTPDYKEYIIVYDKLGRPIKKPVPGRPGIEQSSTNKHGQPVEGMTVTPEGQTGKPVTDDEEPVYDQYGRPIKKPVHSKPEMDDDTTTDKYGESPEGQTSKPGVDEIPEIFGEHGHTGRPFKQPAYTTSTPYGMKVTTDEVGNVVEDVTEIPDRHADKPESDRESLTYDEYGLPKPGVHGKPGEHDTTVVTGEQIKPVENHEINTESSESSSRKPDSDSFVILFDQYGRPHKRPVHKKPGNILTDDEGNPLDVTTSLASGFTNKPEISNLFGQHGRPFKRPGMTEEDDQTVDYGGMTVTPDEFSGRPGSHDKLELFGEHDHTGQPHKQPVAHNEPGTVYMTKPNDEFLSNNQTGRPDISYDEHGQPNKKPGSVKPGYEDGMTELSEGQTSGPEIGSPVPSIFGEHGRPYKRPIYHKKPGMSDEDIMTTDEKGNPVDGVIYQPEDQFASTIQPGEEQFYYGKPGRPHKEPTTDKAAVLTDEEDWMGLQHGTTEYPGFTAHDDVHPVFDQDGRPMKKPDSHKQPQSAEHQESPIDDFTGNTPDEQTSHLIFGEHDHPGGSQHKPFKEKYPEIQGMLSTQEPQVAYGETEKPEIFYGQNGRPVNPLVQKKPSEVMTDEDGTLLNEYEGTTETTDGHSGKPYFIIVYDKNGQSIKKPIQKKPVMHGQYIPVTDKYGKPFEDVTEVLEEQTEKPDINDEKTAYDQFGHPFKPNISQTKPGTSDDEEKPQDELGGTTETPEGYTGTPDYKEYIIVYDKLGRPIKKPVPGRPGIEQSSTNKHGQPVEGMTVTPEGQTGKPVTDDEEPVYDQYGRPIKKPVHSKPGVDGDHKPTDKYGQPVESITEIELDLTETPDYVIMYDNHGRPIKMPVHKTPGIHDEYTPTDKEHVKATSDSTEEYSEKPDNDDYVVLYDQFGRPYKVPIGHKKPVITDETGKPVNKPITEPSTNEKEPVHHDDGHPMKPDDGHKQPGIESEVDTTYELTGTTEIPEEHMGVPYTTDFNIVFDKYGRPMKVSVHDKPSMEDDHTSTDKYGRPTPTITETPENLSGMPESNDEESAYDQYGKPVKRPVHPKPEMEDEHSSTNKNDEHVENITVLPGHTGRPLTDDELPQTPEGYTGTPDYKEYIIVYDKLGRPIKKPVPGRPGIEQSSTNKHGQPVEGMTVTPEGQTGKPVTDDEEPVYDQYGRPIKKPVHSKPEMDDDTTTDKYGESPEGQTSKPGVDEIPEIFGEHGHTGRPFKQPAYTTSTPYGMKVTTDEVGNVVEDVTEIPDRHADKPESDRESLTYDEYGLPKPGVHGKPEVPSVESGKPAYGTTELSVEHNKEPDSAVSHSDEQSKVQENPSDEERDPVGVDVLEGHEGKPGVAYNEDAQKPGYENAETPYQEQIHLGQEIVTMLPSHPSFKPESDSHQILPVDEGHSKPYVKPIGETHLTGLTGQPHETFGEKKKPGEDTADSVTTHTNAMEYHDDHTVSSGTDDEPMIFSKHGHTGRPVKPGILESDGTSEIPEGDDKTESTRPNTALDKDGLPVVQEVYESSQDKHPEGEMMVPGGHKKPQDIEEHSSTSEEGHEPQGKPEEGYEETGMSVTKIPGIEHDYTTDSLFDGFTKKPDPSGTEVYFDENGKPHQRPVETHPISTTEINAHNEVPEKFTGKPGTHDIPGLLDGPGHTETPEDKLSDDETHTTEVSGEFTGRPGEHFDNQGRPLKKPVTIHNDMVTEESEKYSEVPTRVTEPQLFGENGRPQKKPILKPSSGVDHNDMNPDGEGHEGVSEEVPTGKPDHDSTLNFFGETGRPIKKPSKPIEDIHKPEENEIFEGDKATEVTEDDRFTEEPESTKVADPIHGIGEGHYGRQPINESVTEHPEGIWQYLPPKKPVALDEVEGTMDSKPEVKPIVQTTDEDDGDEDDSLIITTDEPEKESEDAHGHSTIHGDEQPTHTKTKIPEESDKPQKEVFPTTPGIDTHSQDITTPGYGSHDSNLPVTDGAVLGHPVTHDVDGQPDLTHLGSDGVSFPGANAVFDKDSKPDLISGHHSESTPGIDPVEEPISTPGYEEKLPVESEDEHEDSSHDTERPAGVTGVPGSTTERPLVTTVINEDGMSHRVNATASNVKGKPDGSHSEEGKPLNVDVVTAEKMPAQGYFPGIPADFIPTFSETNTPNTDNPVMVDGGLNQGSPVDAIMDNLANVLRPIHATEQTEEVTESHEEVPGESDCFLDGKTYPNNSEVPPLSPCHTKCTCINSIIHCLSLKCPSPTENVSQCTMVQDEKSCCPTYICGETSTSPSEGQEETTVSHEEEHGLVEVETPVESHDEETELNSSEVVTEKGQMETNKTFEGKPHDKDQVTTSNSQETDSHTTDKSYIETLHTKPAVDAAHPTVSQPSEQHGSSSMMPGLTEINEPIGEDVALRNTTEGQKKPEETHRPQSGYLPPIFDEHHPSTVLPSYFGTGKPIINVEEHPNHQRPDSDDHVVDEPVTEDKKPLQEGPEEHKPDEPMTTDVFYKPNEEMGETDSSVKVTGQDTVTSGSEQQTKKPVKDPEQDHKPTTPEYHHPSTDEKHPDRKKPDQIISIDDIHGMVPEKSSATIKKPQDQVFTPTEETSYQRPQEPENISEPSELLEESHKKPSVQLPSVDASTVTSPEEKPMEEGQPDVVTGFEQSTLHNPHFGGEEEQTDKKPNYDSVSSDVTESNGFIGQKPLTQDTDNTSQGGKGQKPTSTDQVKEQEHTLSPVDHFGKPSATGQEDVSEPGHDITGKVHPSTEHSPDQSTLEDEKHTKKPEATHVTHEDDEYSIMSPEDKFITSKPTVPSGVSADFHKKPEADKPEEHEPVHTVVEKPHENGTGETPEGLVSPMGGETSPTKITHGEPSEKIEVKPDSVHLTSMDNESEFTFVTPQVKPEVEDDLHKPQTSEDSLHTTGRPQDETLDGHEPQKKPEDDLYIGSIDEETIHFTTTKPHGKPTEDVEESHKKPGDLKPEEDLQYPSSDRPMTPGTDELGEEMSQIPERKPGVSLHPSTLGTTVDGTPEYDSASTEKPQLSLVPDKPQQEEIPEEVLLHPTRTPGTIQTERPDIETDQGTSDHEPVSPSIVGTLSTLFPQVFLSPTKTSTVGADKPKEKPDDSTNHQPQTEKPEDTSDGTGKPVHDLVTELPDNFAEIFGTFRPKPSPGQPDQKPSLEDHLPGTVIFQESGSMKPDEDLEGQKTSEGTIENEDYSSQYTTVMPDSKPGPSKRPVYSTNGTHFIQYVPFEVDKVPQVPQGAILGEPELGSDGGKYWPIIFVKQSTSITELSTEAQTPAPQQVFNGTHFVQYVPFKDDEKPDVPEGATLGQPVKKPDGQFYWPIIDTKPLPSGTEDEPITQASFPGQIYNGTHFIQYLPYDEGKPIVLEGATLGEPQTAPSGEKYWPIISINRIPDEEGTTTGSEQIFNGTHFIQYVPFKDGEAPDIPEDATLGQPQKEPNGQIYWPVINTKPIPVTPSEEETTELPPVQVFNGTNFIQYVPFKDGEPPAVPEGATLGQPQKTPDGEIFWPIIYARPQPVKPEGSLPGQVFNGTHYIQYVLYEEGKKPEVPEDATLGQPQKNPDGQFFWPLIYSKPITTKPEEQPMTTEQPFALQHFNGSHFIQYVPFTEGFEPQLPEEATMGSPITRPDGQMYWPIIYEKLPTTARPEEVQPHLGQVYNGTHFIKYIPYRPNHKPQVLEEATVGDPVKGSDGQMYWPIISTEPLPDLQEESVKPQVFNGTNYIQYVPFTEEKPEVPQEAVLGEPLIKPDGQKFWPIISKKPLPGLPVITQQGPLEEIVPTTVPITEQVYNGTHYIQYLPYKPGQRPVIPDDATIGRPILRPDGQVYWPIIYSTPVPSLPVTTQDLIHEDFPTTEAGVPITEQVYNGTHYIQYVPYKPGKLPVVPEDATLGIPVRRPDNQLYWPIIRQMPVPGLPVTTQQDLTEDELSTVVPVTEQYFNGTHYIQYVPFKPGQRPTIPEGVTLGNSTIRPDEQMYWPITYTTPVPVLPVTTEGLYDEDLPLVDPTKDQIYNGSHYIQYVLYKPGKRPSVPEGAKLGKPTKGPNDEMYWPIIHLKPVPGVPITGEQLSTFDPAKGQLFNGSHYIQYVPYNPMHRPVVPAGAKLGKPTRGLNGQIYWPIIYSKPVPGIPVMTEKPFDEKMPEKGQYFNGTHYIQYEPYIPGQRPLIPEGAILGHPITRTDGQMYWPIIRSRPAPGIPINWTQYEYTTPRPEQIFNGTHYIQYLPYNPTQMPEVPEDTILGHPQKGPGGQMYWILISDKPIPVQTFNGTHVVQYVTPVTPEQNLQKPFQVFNGTHYIQYVLYTPGQRPVVPEGAVLGNPTKGPEGEIYWPIIYKKRPVGEVTSSATTPINGQIFNGTHFILYVPYNSNKRPTVPEGATISKPQRRPDGQKYWLISSKKPLPEMVDETMQTHPGQIYNGTHYIQYVPYNPSQMPQVPDGAVLGHPQKEPDGQMNWVIISDKPVPAYPGTHHVQYVTPVTPEANKFSSGLTHNGTHYIFYIPYKPAQLPHIPNGATLGNLEQGPGGQMYWPMIFKQPPQEPIFNGTHYVTFTPQNATNIENTTKDHLFWDYGQYGATNIKPPTTEVYPSWSKPGQNVTKKPSYEPSQPGYNEYVPGYNKPDKTPGGDDSFDTIDEDHLIEYPSGSDYDETQEQPYGPGTCRYAGKVYVSAQQIPRDDPCDFCFCFRSDIICLQQSCPPPIPGCHEEPIQGFCCPRYECHVRMATLLNVTSTTTTTTTTLPPHFLSHVYNGAAGRTGCFVQGKAYRVGQPIASASGPCMDCICGGDGKMKCEPKICTPEPMVRQMMGSTEKSVTAIHR